MPFQTWELSAVATAARKESLLCCAVTVRLTLKNVTRLTSEELGSSAEIDLCNAFLHASDGLHASFK